MATGGPPANAVAVQHVTNALSRYDGRPQCVLTMLTWIHSLLNNSSLADFKIVCKDRSWEVHRLVIALHSTPLAAACTKHFKVCMHSTQLSLPC
jgi:hypothetical protein